MKYLQGKKNFDLVVKEKEIPVPKHNQVLIKVLACGICGTDLHFLRKNEEYTPLGHEISAIVLEVGGSVTKTAVGEMVVVEDLAACGTCVNCKNGESHVCRNMTGLDGQSGMGEYLLIHENNVVPCKGLTREQATFVEPLAVALNACLAADIREDSALAIWGIGPLGLMCVSLGKYFHAKEIICIAGNKGTKRNQYREKTAYELGATKVIYSEEENWEVFLPKKISSVVVTSPPKTVPDAIRTSGYGAVIVPIGISLDESAVVSINVDELIFQKKKIHPVLAEPARYFPRCVDMIRNGVVPVDKLLTHKIRLTDTEQFRSIFLNDEEVIKGIVVNEYL